MLCRLDADGAQGVEVELLGVVRRRLHEHLELIVVLQAVGVLAVTAVGGTAAGLSIAGAPGLVAKRAQRRGPVERASADLAVIGLQHDATLGRPVVLQGEDDLLERQGILVHRSLPSYVAQGEAHASPTLQDYGISRGVRPKFESSRLHWF